MLEPGQLVDSFIVFDAKSHIARLAFLWRLRFQPCDLWVDLQAPTFNTFGTDARISRRNTWLRRIACSRFQRVFAVNRTWAKISHPVPVPSKETLEQENIVDTTLRLVSEVASVEHDRLKQLVVSGQAQAWASDWWREKQLGSATVLGLFFGAKQPAKFWPQEQVHSLIVNWLNHHSQHSIVVLGAIHEDLLTQALLQRLSAQHSSRVKSAVGACSLTQTAALMQRCHVMVCTDSGPMHMADALQRPMVALMSHHNHQGIWAPVSSNVTVIAKQVACGPCFKDVCDKGNACMDLISAKEVLKEVFTRLESRAL
jgi:ADP-heptose:LPS heptosyltransferase